MTRGRAQRFLVGNRAAAALEFALVAPAFLALVLGGLSVCVLLYSTVSQKIADWPGNLRRRNRGGRDLIEKRLKQVMISAVDHGDADRRPASR